MKVLHLNAGNETGGGMYHIIRLLKNFQNEAMIPCVLGVLEKKTLYERAVEENIQTIYFPNRFRLQLSVLKKIARYIKEEKISHVHTHGPRANVYMYALQRFVHVPWIVTLHSDPFFDFREKGLKGKVLTRLHVQALRRANKIITVCNEFQQTMHDAGICYGLMRTIQNGIDFTKVREKVDRQQLRQVFGFSKNAFLFVKVARFETVKGHEIALKAFAEIIKKGNMNVHLLFVGDGPLKTEMEMLAKTLQIEKNVHFYGERSDVQHFYNLAHVSLLCSLSESFPYVLLESAREKTPVIATDVGDVGLLIERSDFGWKVAPNNISAMQEAMEEAVAYERSNKLHVIGENLHAHASSKFSLAKCAQEVYNVYGDVIKKRPKMSHR